MISARTAYVTNSTDTASSCIFASARAGVKARAARPALLTRLFSTMTLAMPRRRSGKLIKQNFLECPSSKCHTLGHRGKAETRAKAGADRVRAHNVGAVAAVADHADLQPLVVTPLPTGAAHPLHGGAHPRHGSVHPLHGGTAAGVERGRGVDRGSRPSLPKPRDNSA